MHILLLINAFILIYSIESTEALGSPLSRAGFNYKNVVAAIIEHRPLLNLPYVFNNFLEILPEEIDIYFFCSSESAKLIKSALGFKEQKRILFQNDYFGGINVKRMTKIVYNRLILDATFWQYFSYTNKSKVLLFEHDTFLCRGPSSSLESFLGFGYIGAPWLKKSCKSCKPERLRHARNRFHFPIPVGNSGLSIMDTNIMLKLTSPYIKKRTKKLINMTVMRGGCDIYIAAILQDERFIIYFDHLEVAPVKVAKLFSVENLYDGAYIPFGGHNPCNFAENLKRICPQAWQACVRTLTTTKKFRS